MESVGDQASPYPSYLGVELSNGLSLRLYFFCIGFDVEIPRLGFLTLSIRFAHSRGRE